MDSAFSHTAAFPEVIISYVQKFYWSERLP